MLFRSVAAIAKTLDPSETDGENVGVAKFGRDGAAALVGEMTGVLAEGGLREWLPRAFDRFARRRPLRVVETRGWPWTEIDFPEDYWRACAEVLPAIAGSPAGERRRIHRATHSAADRTGRSLHHV